MKVLASCLALAIGAQAFDVQPSRKYINETEAQLEYVAPPVHLSVASPLLGSSLPERAPIFITKDDIEDVHVWISPSNPQKSPECEIEWQIPGRQGVINLKECAQSMEGGHKQNYEISIEASSKRSGEIVNLLNKEILVIDVESKPWPFANSGSQWPPSEPNLVGNLMENYQSFSGANNAYMHEGLDIRSNEMQDLHSPVKGTCVRRVNYAGGSPLYWSLMVQDEDGFVWQFHHLEANSHTIDVGDSVEQGDVVGKVIRWTASHNGVLYHHVHLNVAWPHPSWSSIPLPYVDGWRYYNPFNFFERLSDNASENPTSNGIFYFHPNGQPNEVYTSSEAGQARVTGQTDIIVQLHSLYEPTNNLGGHPYTNGLFSIAYEVEPAPNCGPSCVAVPQTILAEFDTFPGDWPYNQPNYETSRSDVMLRRIYSQSFRFGSTTYTSDFTYSTRRLYYTVTNSHNGQPDADNGFWDTTVGANGEYDVTVRAKDWYGRDLEITHRVNVVN